jgi:hypothetical protein
MARGANGGTISQTSPWALQMYDSLADKLSPD